MGNICSKFTDKDKCVYCNKYSLLNKEDDSDVNKINNMICYSCKLQLKNYFEIQRNQTNKISLQQNNK